MMERERGEMFFFNHDWNLGSINNVLRIIIAKTNLPILHITNK